MKQIALDIGVAVGPSLDNYQTGANAAAVQQLRAWCHAHGAVSVPLYIWGEAGSGKSHLLRATYDALRQQGLQIGWMDAQTRGAVEFSNEWAAVLMDETHLYDAQQQQAAFNWFVNATAPADGTPRGVLAAGFCPPADLPLREDLRTRLGWGHIFQLQVPSEAERRAVLRRAADERGIFLSDEVMDFILNRFSRDLASLMQLLEQLDHYALQVQRAVTIPLVKAMLESE